MAKALHWQMAGARVTVKGEDGPDGQSVKGTFPPVPEEEQR